jgi:dCMP deaminase
VEKSSAPGENLICYIPVLHAGYMQFFAQHPGAHIYVVGTSVLKQYLDYARKDVRALSPEMVVEILTAMGRNASVLELEALESTLHGSSVVLPDDDLSHALMSEFGVQDSTLEPVFLRWDRKAVDANQDVQPDRSVSLPADDAIITVLYEEASKSTNWWRNVAAALVEEGKVTAIAHNGSVPTQYSSALDGDPRITAHRGSDIDTSIDVHAEARLIGGAAKRGETLDGASMYVSTFPCPTCAKLIAASGIKQCYFVEGYATIDGQSVLKASDVEIVKIETTAEPTPSRQKSLEYPSSRS